MTVHATSLIPQGPDGFGKRLQRLRERKRISRRVLADFVLISYSSIRHYERGEMLPDIATACRIAEFFNVSLDWLAGVQRDEWH